MTIEKAKLVYDPVSEEAFLQTPTGSVQMFSPTTLAGAAGAGIVGYDQDTDYDDGTIGKKLQQFVNVDDFGAVGDGVTDDTATFELARAKGLSVRLTPGKIYALSEFSPPARMVIDGQGARIRRAADATFAMEMSNTYGTLKDVCFDQDVYLADGLVDPAKAAVSTIVSFPATRQITVSDASTFAPGMVCFFEAAGIAATDTTMGYPREEANIINAVDYETDTLTLESDVIGALVSGARIVADYPMLKMANGAFFPAMHNVTMQRFVVGILTGDATTSAGNATPMANQIRANNFVGAAVVQRENFGVEIFSDFIYVGSHTVTKTHTATAAQTAFAYAWNISPRVHRKGYLTVKKNGVTLTETTDFTIDDTTGVVTLTAGATSGDTILLTNSEYAARGLLCLGEGGTVNSAGRSSNGAILACSMGAELRGGTGGIEFFFGSAVTIDSCSYAGMALIDVSDICLTGWNFLFCPYPLIINDGCSNVLIAPVTTSVTPSGDIHNPAAYPFRKHAIVDAGATRVRIPRSTWLALTSGTIDVTAATGLDNTQIASTHLHWPGTAGVPGIGFNGHDGTGFLVPLEDRLEALVGGSRAWLCTEDSRFVLGGGTLQLSNGTTITGGSGSPESVVTAIKGSFYLRDDASNTFVYIKTTGSGSTGWRAIGVQQTGFTTAAGTANKNASAINVGTITATDANVQALAKWVKALHDALASNGSIAA